MPSANITEAWIKKVKPPAKHASPNQITYFHRIQTGLALMLVVSYGGTKRFRVMTYDANGKGHSYKLGMYPEMSVKKAFKAAHDFYHDPERFAEKSDERTFKDIAQLWLEEHVIHEGLRSRREIERCLKVYVFPAWGNTMFLTIRRPQVSQFLRNIAKKHGRGQSKVVLSLIRRVFNFYEGGESETYTTPISTKHKIKSKARTRTLNPDEIRLVWKEADGVYGDILRLCLLLAQRRAKVAKMRWTDIVDGVWTIPTEAREKGNAGTLKLPQLALDIIYRQFEIAGNPYVFGKKPDWVYCKKRLDKKLPSDMPPWVVHDLRRTASTVMNEIGVLPHIVEQVLGHAIPGVAGTYNRAEYNAQKADALQRLANHINGLVNPPPANVVNISEKKKARRA
jgi:integrase